MPRRSRTRGGLPEWLSLTAQPVFVVDSRRVVLFFNRGCERLTGWAAGDLIGKVCEVHSDGVPGQVTTLLSALCPPSDAEPTSQRIHLLTREGQSLDRVAHFFPLPPIEADPDKPEPLRWLGVIGLPQSPLTVSPMSAESELHAELSALKSDLRKRYSLAQVVAAGTAMQRTLARLQLAVSSNTTIAFSGAAGTGKEHLARAVHYASEARMRAFVPVDCRQPAEPLNETLGRLRQPEREELAIPLLRVGAVLLQHVESLPGQWQMWLTKSVDLNPGPHAVRWMLSSEQSSEELVESETLLPEFRDRFGVLEVALPTLRDRPLDLPLLAQHALEECNVKSPKQLSGFSPDVWEQFRAYNWPGQLDELFTVIREAHAASAGPLVSVRDLPFRFRAGQDAQSVSPPPVVEPVPLDALLLRVEKEQLEAALARANGSKQLAADLLGIPRAKLYRRLEAHGLWKPGES